MRSEEEWIRRFKIKTIRNPKINFPPRIQEDLLRIPTPKNIPNPIENTYIFGNVDSGKTIFASFMLLEEKKNLYIDYTSQNEEGWDKKESKNENCVFISVPDLFNEIKNTYNQSEKAGVELEPYEPWKKNGITERRILDYYCNAHLLLLDDFGLGKPTDWILEILYLIINHRYDFLKKTIFTSNCSLEEVAKIFGDDRIVSRILRMCKENIIEKIPYKK